MQLYLDLSGQSGISAYEVRDNAIIVRFKNGHTYIYDTTWPGKEQIEEMKKRAEAGRGLATYISQEVRNHYAGKFGETVGSIR